MAELPTVFKDADGPTTLSQAERTELWHSLTELQQRWVVCWLENGFNATQAAKDAGYQAENERNFREIGHQNRNHPKIRRLSSALMERHIGTDETLMRLSDIAKGSMQDFVSTNKEGVPQIDLGKAKKRGVLHLIKDLKIEPNDEGPPTIRVKLYSKVKALKTIADLLELGSEEEAGDQVTVYQQVNNYLEGDDSIFDDVDNEV